MTPTQLALAVDRLAKEAKSDAVYGTDYSFGATPSEVTKPIRGEDETPESYQAAMTAWREENPPTWEIQTWDTEVLGTKPTHAEVLAEATSPVVSIPECIKLCEQHVEQSGFTASRLVTLMDLLMQVKEADALATRPKLVALYTWLQTVKATAIAGSVIFPPAPHTFEEVITEGA